MINNLSPEEKYKELIERCGIVFAEWSKDKDEKYRKWKYALCATPIQLGKGIILGINWGVGDQNYVFCPSEPMPTITDYSIDDYPFLKRSNSYLLKYLHIDAYKPNFNYTNLCLFRTPKAKNLILQDYISCQEIIKAYIEFINPPWILSLSLGNYDILKKTIPKNEIQEYKNQNSNSYGPFVLKIWNYKFLFLPHPNSQTKQYIRDNIWHETFKQHKVI